MVVTWPLIAVFQTRSFLLQFVLLLFNKNERNLPVARKRHDSKSVYFLFIYSINQQYMPV
jgi:hypothetical protein